MKNALFTVIIVALSAGTSFAIHTKSGDNIIISNPIYEDVYIGGGTVTVNAPVHGDMVIAGGTLVLNDTVTGDVIMAGGNITINGTVSDDVRGAGGEMHINGDIGGDLVVAGGDIIVATTSEVQGSVLMAAGNITIDGNVHEELKCWGGELKMNGVVGKSADCRGDKITVNGTINGAGILAAREIIIGENAAFYNGTRYWAENEKVDFRSSVKNGNPVYDESLEIDDDRWEYLGFASALAVLWYLAVVFIFIVLIQYLFGNTMKNAAKEAQDNSLNAIGSGLLYFIGVPVAAVLVMVTIIGIPVGLMALVFYLMLAGLATVISSVLVANWWNNRREHKWNFWPVSFVALGMFLILKFISFIPFVGWLVMFVIACLAFGSILRKIITKRGATVA